MNSDLIAFGFYLGGVLAIMLAPFAYLEYELRIEAIFKRYRTLLFTKMTDILNWLESFRKHNKNN